MKFSIIIPCYNEQDNIVNLVNTLNSVRGKRPIEFIMVENGSKDNTREVLEKECAPYDYFKIAYVEVNQGYGYGLQQGIKAATGDYIGWIHADLQVAPQDAMKCVNYILNKNKKGENTERVFLKGRRHNRSLVDHFFTGGMTVYASARLRTKLNDIGAIPVLFHKNLLEKLDKMPYDFSIETYVYMKAVQNGYKIVRFPVILRERVAGQSSWSGGLSKKIAQSKRIMKDIILIAKDEQVV